MSSCSKPDAVTTIVLSCTGALFSFAKVLVVKNVTASEESAIEWMDTESFHKKSPKPKWRIYLKCA